MAVRGSQVFFCGIVSVELLMQGQAVPAPPLPSPDRRLLRRGKGAPVAHHGAAARATSACSFTIQFSQVMPMQAAAEVAVLPPVPIPPPGSTICSCHPPVGVRP